MKVTHLCFLGIKTNDFPATVHFFHDVLGLPIRFENDLWTGLTLSSGRRDMVEVFGQDKIDPRLFAVEAGDGPLIAFAVDDLESAYRELVVAGVEVIGQIVWASDFKGQEQSTGFGWFFFRAPDGKVYALQQDR
jgi:catechol 2,3-dioxygenase-like lactoylglutathione lyase family enzyme